MPGLEPGEQQADRDERAPKREKDARLAKLEHAREKPGGQDEESYLDAPKNQVRKPQRHVHERLPLMLRARFCSNPHSLSSTMRTIFCKSFSLRWRDLTRWTRRGSAEPLNTRSMNSRIMPLMICFCGCAGR